MNQSNTLKDHLSDLKEETGLSGKNIVEIDHNISQLSVYARERG